MQRKLQKFSPKVWWSWYQIWGTLPVLSWIEAASYFRAGNFRRAAECYARGLAARPNHPAAACARLDLAYSLFRQGSLPEAALELQTLTSRPAPIRDASLLLAKIQLISGQFRGAIDTIRRAQRLYADDPLVIAAYAQTTVAARAPYRMLEYAKRVVKNARGKLNLTDNRMIHLDAALAALEIRLGNREDGEQLLARVLASGQAPAEVFLTRGELYMEGGRIALGREQFSRAAQQLTQDPRPLVHLSRSYLLPGSFGNFQYALQLAQRACQLSCWQNTDCLEVLIDAYEACGESDTAGMFLQRLKRLASLRELGSFSQEVSSAEASIHRLRYLRT